MERREEQVREQGQVCEARRETRFNPENRYKRNSHGDRDNQKNTKWKVFDVDWNENVISEHEEIREDALPRDRSLETKSKDNLGNPKQSVVDLSEEVEDDRSIFENHAIIGRIVGPKFPRTSIRSWVNEHWGKHVVIKFLPKGFFVAVFTEAEEKDRKLCSQNWFLDSHPIYLQPWSPNFDPTHLVIYDKPLWIRLFNLPSEYWRNPYLE
ncbi:hypothetical protein SUGI_0278450 [Cryptomeria japonica]|nr:hypothetical protein SUGI_0278450 [Cryptomeria japonica]